MSACHQLPPARSRQKREWRRFPIMAILWRERVDETGSRNRKRSRDRKMDRSRCEESVFRCRWCLERTTRTDRDRAAAGGCSLDYTLTNSGAHRRAVVVGGASAVCCEEGDRSCCRFDSLADTWKDRAADGSAETTAPVAWPMAQLAEWRQDRSELASHASFIGYWRQALRRTAAHDRKLVHPGTAIGGPPHSRQI